MEDEQQKQMRYQVRLDFVPEGISTEEAMDLKLGAVGELFEVSLKQI